MPFQLPASEVENISAKMKNAEGMADNQQEYVASGDPETQQFMVETISLISDENNIALTSLMKRRQRRNTNVLF